MAELWLRRYLTFVGSVSTLAFAAAVMPQQWIVEIAEELGFDPFPHSPLTFYLARHLSLLYGFVGVALLLVVTDMDRYRPLVPWIAIGTIVFGILQGIVDIQSGLPRWWALVESLWVAGGGLILFLFDRRASRI